MFAYMFAGDCSISDTFFSLNDVYMAFKQQFGLLFSDLFFLHRRFQDRFTPLKCAECLHSSYFCNGRSLLEGRGCWWTAAAGGQPHSPVIRGGRRRRRRRPRSGLTDNETWDGEIFNQPITLIGQKLLKESSKRSRPNNQSCCRCELTERNISEKQLLTVRQPDPSPLLFISTDWMSWSFKQSICFILKGKFSAHSSNIHP